MGSAELTIDSHAIDIGPSREAPPVYAGLADLVIAAAREVDTLSLEFVADAFIVG